MSDKRMLIVDATVAQRVDENRGDMNRSDFLNFLIDSGMKEDSGKQQYITEEDFAQFQQGTKELLRNFLEFFVSYSMELGDQPKDKTFEELSQKLQALGRADNKAKNL